jgi:hypothetical protein
LNRPQSPPKPPIPDADRRVWKERAVSFGPGYGDKRLR